jgi:hypothetical protein
MAVTCQYCGTEADGRVMCPNCGRRMRPRDEEAQPVSETAAQVGTEDAYGVTPAAAQPDPWTMPGLAESAEPTRPQVLYARDVITKASRVRVAFRFILVIPHIIALLFVGIAFVVVGVVSWFTALFIGRLPDGMHGFQSGVIRYMTRVFAYLGLLTDRYPPFGLSPDPAYAVEYQTTHEKLNRLAVFFRFILAIPAYIVQYVLGIGLYVFTFIAWFVVLILGRMPESLFDALAGAHRYNARYNSYFWLVTPAYPGGLFDDGQPPFQDEAGREPPRQTPATKKCLIAFIVVGAAVAIVAGIINGISGAKNKQAIDHLNDAHTAVIRALESNNPACSRAPNPLACAKANATTDAAAFTNFESRVADVHIGRAKSEEARLASTSHSLATAYKSLASATTLQQYQTLAAGARLDTLLQQWDDDWGALADAVNNP